MKSFHPRVNYLQLVTIPVKVILKVIIPNFYKTFLFYENTNLSGWEICPLE